MSSFWVRRARDIVSVVGPDAKSFLHSQLSQDITSLHPGSASASFILQPNGKIDALVRVRCLAQDSFALDCEPGFGEVVVARLQRFKIRVKAEINFTRTSCISHRGCVASPRADAVAAWRGDGSAWDVFDSEPPTEVAEGTDLQFESARVACAWPLMGVDITSEMIPGETGITDCAVSFTKGCYPGQELVERMDSRGATAPRSLRTIAATPQSRPGSPVLLDGVEVGTYTSVAGLFGLALIKRGTDISRL